MFALNSYNNEVLPYVDSESVYAYCNYSWYNENNCVVCPSDHNLELDKEPDPFGISDAMEFQKK